MKKTIIFCTIVIFLCMDSFAQSNKKIAKEETPKPEKVKEPIDEIDISGLKWRNIGPAITSGRISDFAVNPENPFEYYVATSAGGVWKTVNSGVTYEPIFDSQGSYSIGCVSIDLSNTNVVWVGTGENNNQRSVSYGDGIYKSLDGGKSWNHMGLKNSEHIGSIVIHPENSEIVYVAAIGPLWSKGGDRGVYKTIDGGKTWNAILTIDEHTGVNEIHMDPRNPNILYASAFQRRRHVFTYVGGGPGSSLYKSMDAGETWTKINKGLPDEELGRIGLAISPADPDVIYAIVEAANNKGGFYRSIDKGESWTKMSGHNTSGNYYQEIIADPIDENTVFSMDTWFQISNDGGKTFKNAGEDFKHVDNHCIWINPKNNSHWLVGCDGGIYETFDKAKTWDFKENLPVTQFYKVALDNDVPFYNVYGGTQDNFSLGGPSRTTTAHGIMNSDWFITNGGDGFESQVDPFNADIVYAQSQYGNLIRFDRKSGEGLGIQPKERKNELAYRWNWDAPLAVSSHVEGRLYFAANKVFRSDDFGNSWNVLGDDLSAQIDRNKLKVFDKVLSIDAVSKNGSTSQYGTIVALSESPIDPNLIAIGTDDGLIQITENGGETWRKIENIPGAPIQSYVNSVYLSKHDSNRIYAAFNHHKYGDFKPYIFKSEDKGATWTNISSNLPERGSVYAIEEDFENSGLIFCGTEFGVFFSPNKGDIWKKIGSGLPTIAVRDIAIQKRETDLVIATFGRGFYVLDDYSALRNIKNEAIVEQVTLFPIREALMWEQNMPLGLPGKAFQGDNFYSAENLGPEVMFTYFFNDDIKSKKDIRKDKEKELAKNGSDIFYPSYEELKAEDNEIPAQLILIIRDSNLKIVKKIYEKPKKGLQRIKWDLRYNPRDPVSLGSSSFYNPFAGKNEGNLVNPGTYSVEMELLINGQIEQLMPPVAFNVKALNNTVIPNLNREDKVAFQTEIMVLTAEIDAVSLMISEMNNKIKYMKEAAKLANAPNTDLMTPLFALEENLKNLSLKMYGDRLKSRLDIDEVPTPAQRIGGINYEQKYSTAPPTETHKRTFEIAKEEFGPIQKLTKELYTVDIIKMEELLKSVGAPYTPGRALQEAH